MYIRTISFTNVICIIGKGCPVYFALLYGLLTANIYAEIMRGLGPGAQRRFQGGGDAHLATP